MHTFLMLRQCWLTRYIIFDYVQTKMEVGIKLLYILQAEFEPVSAQGRN